MSWQVKSGGAKDEEEEKLLFLSSSSPRRNVLLVELDEQHESPERDPPAPQHAGDAERPAQAGHGEG